MDFLACLKKRFSKDTFSLQELEHSKDRKDRVRCNGFSILHSRVPITCPISEKEEEEIFKSFDKIS